MSETVTIARVEYERLCALEEELADVQEALAFEARIAIGTEELIPEEIANRLIDGDPPLRVWREYRGLSQSALSRSSEVSRIQIVDIEAGRNTGSVGTLRKLAESLGIAVDDLVLAEGNRSATP